MKILGALVLIGCIASTIADCLEGVAYDGSCEGTLPPRTTKSPPPSSCGTLQRLKVKQQWAQAFGQGTSRETFGTALWRNLFEREPAARALFERVNGDNVFSNEFQAHIQRVLGGLDMSISLLDDEGTLNAELAHLKNQHADREIAAANYDVFKQALLDVVPDELGSCFDQDAWSVCFDVIANGIKG